MIKFLLILLFTNFVSSLYAESILKAGDSLIWNSEDKTYIANGDVEFKNDKFIAFADEMNARYIEQGDKEVFTIVELFLNVIIELKDEVFEGDYAIYTRDDNIIRLTGNVSVKSPTRLLKGYELIADIDNNKRILNSADDGSLVEVLLDNNADN